MFNQIYSNQSGPLEISLGRIRTDAAKVENVKTSNALISHHSSSFCHHGLSVWYLPPAWSFAKYRGINSLCRVTSPAHLNLLAFIMMDENWKAIVHDKQRWRKADSVIHSNTPIMPYADDISVNNYLLITLLIASKTLQSHTSSPKELGQNSRFKTNQQIPYNRLYRSS